MFRCISCEVVFGNYFCSICRMFDDADKGQFHCGECGICRVGGRENFFHCITCGLCLPLSRKDNHKLVCFLFFNQVLLTWFNMMCINVISTCNSYSLYCFSLSLSENVAFKTDILNIVETRHAGIEIRHYIFLKKRNNLL